MSFEFIRIDRKAGRYGNVTLLVAWSVVWGEGLKNVTSPSAGTASGGKRGASELLKSLLSPG